MLVLSRELFGAGAWPVLSVSEERRVHSNLSGIFRMVLDESFAACEGDMFRDAELYKVYELRPPMAFIRFARLRLSVSIVNKATDEC